MSEPNDHFELPLRGAPVSRASRTACTWTRELRCDALPSARESPRSPSSLRRSRNCSARYSLRGGPMRRVGMIAGDAEQLTGAGFGWATNSRPPIRRMRLGRERDSLGYLDASTAQSEEPKTRCRIGLLTVPPARESVWTARTNTP
jgi:hypothetical protein